MTVRAHFDGKVIVPDEPVSLPLNTPLDVDIKPANGSAHLSKPTNQQIQAGLKALEQIVSRGVSGANIPDEMLRREHLYDDRA